MRVAVTGAGGRLGRALVASLAPDAAIPWTRPDFDLDSPARFDALVARDEPAAVIHAAAWTDVDGCARDPELAQRRNGEAVRHLAAACAPRGIDLILISTNEIFDGLRLDGRGYGADDAPSPGNAYGASKLLGERAATEAFVGQAGHLAIVRTSWLFGAPGGDFPDKIVSAARRAVDNGQSMRLVADEFGNPTSAVDLAAAVVAMVRSGIRPGLHHVTNQGVASRASWAREILRLADLGTVPTTDTSASEWPRASTPPLRAVLRPTPLPGSMTLPTWQEATATYLPSLLLAQRAAESGSEASLTETIRS